MSSDNPSGADNQQETAESLELDDRWVAGFVDGEGCFSISFHRNPFIRATRNWQIQPVFQVSQHQRPSSGARSVGAVLRLRIRPRQGASKPSADLRGQPARGPGATDHPVLRDVPTVRQGLRLPDVRTHRAGARAQGAPGASRLRATHSPRLWDECPWEAASADVGRRPRRILRDCTPGPIDRWEMRQSDLHGDMQSKAEMTLPVSAELTSNNSA